MHDRKYKIEGGRLVKRSNGVPVPEDEPLFILRAKDRNALPALVAYSALCVSLEHKEEVTKSVNDFVRFRNQNPNVMGEPSP